MSDALGNVSFRISLTGNTSHKTCVRLFVLLFSLACGWSADSFSANSQRKCKLWRGERKTDHRKCEEERKLIQQQATAISEWISTIFRNNNNSNNSNNNNNGCSHNKNLTQLTEKANGGKCNWNAESIYEVCWCVCVEMERFVIAALCSSSVFRCQKSVRRKIGDDSWKKGHRKFGENSIQKKRGKRKHRKN